MNWYKKASDNIWFHASPIDNLNIIGIDPEALPHVSNDKQGYVYMGSKEYILNQYLKYAHKGIYYIYQVNTSNITLDRNLPGEQVRTKEFIDPSRINLIEKINNEPEKHPLEREYLEWYNSK